MTHCINRASVRAISKSLVVKRIHAGTANASLREILAFRLADRSKRGAEENRAGGSIRLGMDPGITWVLLGALE